MINPFGMFTVVLQANILFLVFLLRSTNCTEYTVQLPAEIARLL